MPMAHALGCLASPCMSSAQFDLWRATHLEEAFGANALATAPGAVQGGVVQEADRALLELQSPKTALLTTAPMTSA